MATQAQVQSVIDAVESGAIATATYDQLVTYSAWLATTPGANRMTTGNYEQVSKVVHLHLSRSVIEAFERRSKVQAFGTLVFAVMAIVATLMPYFIAPSPSGASKQEPAAQAVAPSKRTSEPQAQLQATTPSQPAPTAQAVSATARQSKSKTP